MNNKAPVINQSYPEIAALIVLLGIFFLANILTATRSPTVWIDEVMYTDPAANLYFGNGFASSAWPFQPSNKFWAGNVPFHQLLLYHWITVFGFSPTAVRSLNYLLMMTSGIILWSSVIRLKLITNPRFRIALVGLLLTGYGISFSYRSGRPDCITITLFLASVLACSIKNNYHRYFALVAISILFPFAGPQLVAYSFILGMFFAIIFKRLLLCEFICVISGAATGICLLFGLYFQKGVLHDFLASIKGHSLLGKNFLDRLGSAFVDVFSNVDWSGLLLFSCILILIFYCRRRNETRFFAPLLFGVVTFFGVPFAMAVISKGHHPIYYAWMTFIPLLVTGFYVIERLDPNPSWQKHVIFGILVLTCAVGLPVRLALTIVQWDERDYAPVETLVKSNVIKTDRVYCDFQPYYAVKKTAKATFLPTYLPAMLAEEKRRISVLVIDPENFPAARSEIGGEWRPGDQIDPNSSALKGLGAIKYKLQVFRRIWAAESLGDH